MDRNEVIEQAFRKACKYLREHPPADAGWDGDMAIIQILAGGMINDPEGKRWMTYFIKQVLDEMEETE